MSLPVQLISGADADPQNALQRQLDYRTKRTILCLMAAMTEVEKLASELPEKQRALLAAHLLDSLSPVLYDEDEGVAEAWRRDAEMEANPALGISLEQLDEKVKQCHQ